ncbi:MAG: hypothetical protein EOP86_05360 [Verrucomicrobiaceae bacterium]|nr:MAG: hypothetical protein EOP86_05360 [Verrucomicrobiaceae bacterium]
MQQYGRLLSFYAGPGLLLGPAEKELNESLTTVAGFVPAAVDFATLLLYVEEAFFRRGNWEKTAATADRYFSLVKDLNLASGFAIRYWAVAVDNLKSGRDPLLKAFQKVFESRTDEKERPRNLWLYGVILTQDGRPEEAAALIQKELESGQLDDSHPMMPQLKALLKEGRNTPSRSPDDAAALASLADRWVKTVKPAWLDWVEPVGKEGPELVAKAVEVLRGTGQYPDTTILKSVVTVLRDPSQPADIREEAVNRFVVNAPMGSADPARRSVEWNAVFTASAMPEPLRARSLAVWVLECASQGWSGTFRRWSVHPLLASATEGQQFLIRQWRGVLADGSMDRAKLKAAALALLERDLEEGMTWSFRQLFMCLANQDPAAAEEVMKVLKEKPFQKPMEEMAEQMTVEMRRYLEDVRELEPAHAALTGAVLKSLSEEAALPLSDADLLSGEMRGASVNAPATVRLALLLRHISSRNFDHSSMDVWSELLWCLDPAESRPVREAMARAVLQSATSDEAASRAVELTGGCLDIDDPEEARLWEELLKPLAGKDDWTSTADWLAFAGAVKSLRTGAATDVTHVIAELHDPELKASLARRQIQTFLATERKTELKKFIRRTPSSTLLDFSCLAASISAWRALDQQEEAETGVKRLKSSLVQAMGAAWSLRSVRRINGILEAVTDVKDPSLVPPGLEEDLIRWVAEPKDLAAARFMIAYLREDWKTCAGLSGEVIRNRPTVYPRYFLAGKACAKMGLKDQAVPLLKTYLEKTHDEIPIPEARALLKSLEP